MASQTEKGVVILTSSGTDGACAAAMMLHVYPHASLVITSQNRIGNTLESLLEMENPPSHIHICGVGISDPVDAVYKTLKLLKQKKITVYWYCGRGYLSPYKEALQKVCKPLFEEHESNTSLIVAHHKISDSLITQLASQLAREYVTKAKKNSNDHQYWHDFFECASAKFAKFEDNQAFIEAIRHLAFQGNVTIEIKREVDTYRQYYKMYFPLGKSTMMKDLRKRIQQIGPIPEPVLILGPTGCGKEITARMLHEASGRKGSFIPVNCAIANGNPDLAHNRLFGHRKGAFTDAKTDQQGAFDDADEGTLFLDEIAELPLAIQTHLLRVLEEKRFTPMGSTESRPVNVRLIAATNQNLPAMIQSGTFRADLFHRINILCIQLHPLIEHKEDMKEIAHSILYDLENCGFSMKLTDEDWNHIYAYEWPGNVRQFRNVLKRAAYMNISMKQAIQEDPLISQEKQNAQPADIALFHPQFPEEVRPSEEIVAAYTNHVYHLFHENVTQTAQALDVSPNTVKKRIKSVPHS